MKIRTAKPVAFDSPDHLQPWGTARDNSTNPRFNAKLLNWVPASELRLLDVGCSGGGFVKTLLDRGSLAVGVEGSDYSQRHRRAEWATIPEHLFTADATEPFEILAATEGEGERAIRFNVITAWEFIEHIAEDKLPGVAANFQRLLLPDGVVIMSVSPNEEVIDGVTLHQTVAPQAWWIDQWKELGFTHHPEVLTYFDGAWVRGGGDAPGSFHLLLTRTGESLPNRMRLRTLMLLQPWLRAAWKIRTRLTQKHS